MLKKLNPSQLAQTRLKTKAPPQQRADVDPSALQKTNTADEVGKKAPLDDVASTQSKTSLQTSQDGTYGASVYGAESNGGAVMGMKQASKGATLGTHRFADVQFLSAGQKKELSRLLDRAQDKGITDVWASPPADMQKARQEVIADLKDVPVRGPGGVKTNVLDKLMNDPDLGMSTQQRERVLDVLAESKHNFGQLEQPGDNYQDINWKHTRGEIDQVMESCKLNGLSPTQTEDALLASIFSDCVKNPANFITHNVDGAAAAATALKRHFGGDDVRAHGVTQAVLEHQIGPPKFMSMIMGFVLNGALKDKTPEDANTIASIQKKVADPLAHRTQDGSQVDFTFDEKAVLQQAGIDKWSTPHDGKGWSKASRALIDGDSLINYASPDGWAKIAAIRGPGTMFQDATVQDSIKSAKQSFDDAYSVVSDKAKPLADAGLAHCEKGLTRMGLDVSRWIEDQGDRVPRNADGKVAFWDAPLKYPDKDGGGLNAQEQAAFDFAKEIKDHVVQLLRDEQGKIGGDA